jgi:hypothetical protein
MSLFVQNTVKKCPTFETGFTSSAAYQDQSKIRPGFMIRRSVDKANRRNLISIIVMHRPLLFPESIEIMIMLLVSSGM